MAVFAVHSCSYFWLLLFCKFYTHTISNSPQICRLFVKMSPAFFTFWDHSYAITISIHILRSLLVGSVCNVFLAIIATVCVWWLFWTLGRLFFIRIHISCPLQSSNRIETQLRSFIYHRSWPIPKRNQYITLIFYSYAHGRPVTIKGLLALPTLLSQNSFFSIFRTIFCHLWRRQSFSSVCITSSNFIGTNIETNLLHTSCLHRSR